MASTTFAARVSQARIRVTVQRPEWGGPAQIYCREWRLDAWAGLPPEQLEQVIYLPGAFANFAPQAPLILLETAWERGIPLYVTALDLPEYGNSRLPPGWADRMAHADSFVDDATLLNAVLDQVAPGRVTLVGWSTGANVATIMAALAPARVTGLQLCMPAGFVTQPVLTRLVPNFTWTSVVSLADPTFRALLTTAPPLEQSLELARSVGKLPAILQMIRLLGQGNAVPYAARVRCPVVFVLARGDIVFAPLIAMHERGELARLFPQAPAVTVHILEGANHNGFSTHSRQVAASTLDLVAGARGSGGDGWG